MFERIPEGLVRDILAILKKVWFRNQKLWMYPYLGKYLESYEGLLSQIVNECGLKNWQQEKLSEFNLRASVLALGIAFMAIFDSFFISVAMILLVTIWYLPYMLLRVASKQRHEAMLKELPQLIDYLALCGGGGLNLYQSLKLVTQTRQGIFYHELKEVVDGVEVGIPLTRGLMKLKMRVRMPVLESFLGSLIYGETLGIPLKETLQGEAEVLRTLRRQNIEKSLNAVPFKMTIISMIFLFPVVVIVVLLPHIVSFVNSNW